MEQVFTNLGINAIGLMILWLYMKETMKKDKSEFDAQLEKDKEVFKAQLKQYDTQSGKVDKLCDKIDRIVDAMHEMVTKDVQRIANENKQQEEIREQYKSIASKLDNISKTVEAVEIRTSMCPKKRVEGSDVNT